MCSRPCRTPPCSGTKPRAISHGQSVNDSTGVLQTLTDPDPNGVLFPASMLTRQVEDWGPLEGTCFSGNPSYPGRFPRSDPEPSPAGARRRRQRLPYTVHYAARVPAWTPTSPRHGRRRCASAMFSDLGDHGIVKPCTLQTAQPWIPSKVRTFAASIPGKTSPPKLISRKKVQRT
jgi:hypothetical protein